MLREQDPPGQRAMLRRFPLLFAITRVGDRLQILLQPKRASDHRWTPALAAGSLAVDLATAAAMRRYRLRLRHWLPLDLIQGAIWAGFVRDDTDSATAAILPGTIISAEAALRHGIFGLFVPILQGTLPAAVRKARGQRPRFWLSVWGLVAGLVALTFRTYERRRQRDEHRRRVQTVEARSESARLAGRNQVAVGQETVIDLLEGVAYLLENNLHAPCTAERAFMLGFRENLAEVTRRRASYLADALLSWQSEHNRHPDLSTAVELHIEPGDATILLSKTQSKLLHRGLDRLDDQRALAGRRKVEVTNRREATRPEGARHLRVDGLDIYIPADKGRPPWFFEPAPIGLLLQGAWMAVPVLSAYEGVPPAVGLPVPAATLATGAWASRHLERHGARGRRDVVLASFGLALSQALITTTAMRKPYQPSGEMRVPGVLALNGYHLMVGYGLPQLSTSERLMAGVGSILIAAAAAAASPSPRQSRTLAVRFLRPWVALIAVTGLAADIERAGSRSHEAALDNDRRLVEEKRLEGSAEVLEHAERVLSALWGQFAAVTTKHPLSPDTAEVVSEINRRLVAARHECSRLRDGLFSGGQL